MAATWNRFARFTAEDDFAPRHGLDDAALLALFAWSEDEFLHYAEGSAIRRTGYEGWLRNIAVALGNARPTDPQARAAVTGALRQRRGTATALVREHIDWALDQHLEAPEQF